MRWLALLLVMLSFTATAQTARIANPASVNCEKQGGVLSIEKRGDGGEYGLCRFGERKACEEWALMRLECPAGGVDLTPYATPAARYCVAVGGVLSLLPGQTDERQGDCHLPESKTCPVAKLYDGGCR